MASSAMNAAANLQLVPSAQGARAGGLSRLAAAPTLAAPTRQRPCRERVPHGPGALEQRAAKRARALPAAAGAPVAPGEPSFLELQSVTPKAAQDYQSYVAAFYQWSQQRGFVANFGTSLTSAPAIDVALTAYMHEKFFAGELAYVPTELMAGPRYFRTYPNGVTLELPRSARALTGWRRMVPAQSRLPYPWVALCLSVQHMIGAGKVMEAPACIITFALYLRPSECLRMKGKLSTPPTQGQVWSILLHPQERAGASKNGCVDESLLADNLLFPWLPQVLAALKAKFPGDSLVFSFGQARWGRALEGAAVARGLSTLGEPSPYRLRHGGVSHDLLFKARTLLSAEKRGRSDSDRSLARYEKGGRISEQLSPLAPSRRQRTLAQPS